MSRPGPAPRLLLATGVQLLLVALLVSPAVLDRFGAREVTLVTAPVDPRDVLRGQYLTLGYPVSRVRAGPGVEAGSVAYVPLREGAGGRWTGERATAERPASGVFLRGRVQWVEGGRAVLNYGLERFYVSEDAARLEEERGASGLRARVRVAPSGRARLLGLSRDGVEIR